MCEERQCEHLDGDALAKLYNDTITSLLYKQVPVCQVTCRRRSSSVWFDDKCRRAKRTLRSMENAARRAGPLSDASSPTATACPEASVLHPATAEAFFLDESCEHRPVTAASPLAVFRRAAWSQTRSRAPPSSTPRHCTASSTRLQAFVHPQLSLICRTSRPFLSAVNFGCSHLFHQS